MERSGLKKCLVLTLHIWRFSTKNYTIHAHVQSTRFALKFNNVFQKSSFRKSPAGKLVSSNYDHTCRLLRLARSFYLICTARASPIYTHLFGCYIQRAVAAREFHLWRYLFSGQVDIATEPKLPSCVLHKEKIDALSETYIDIKY